MAGGHSPNCSLCGMPLVGPWSLQAYLLSCDICRKQAQCQYNHEPYLCSPFSMVRTVPAFLTREYGIVFLLKAPCSTVIDHWETFQERILSSPLFLFSDRYDVKQIKRGKLGDSYSEHTQLLQSPALQHITWCDTAVVIKCFQGKAGYVWGVMVIGETACSQALEKNRLCLRAGCLSTHRPAPETASFAMKTLDHNSHVKSCDAL